MKFWGPFREFGDPQNNSISTVNTLRIYGCDGFLDAKIANNARRIEVSGQLYTWEALHGAGLVLFGDISVMVVNGVEPHTVCQLHANEKLVILIVHITLNNYHSDTDL